MRRRMQAFDRKRRRLIALRSAVAGGLRRPMLIPWTSLLDQIAVGASAAGDSRTEAHIARLRALTGRKDAEAFLPLSTQELAPMSRDD